MTAEELIEEMQKFIPGYYLGCTLKIVDTTGWNSRNLGKTFVSVKNWESLPYIISNWQSNSTVARIDPANIYCINYLPHQLRVVAAKEEPKPEPKKEPEVLVFGKFKIGQIVVSLCDVGTCRKEGDIFKVLPDSYYGTLYYQGLINSVTAHEWRAATPEEIEAYEQGIRNIHQIQPKELDKVEVCKKYLEQLPEPWRTAAISQMNPEFINKRDVVCNLGDAILSFNAWGITKEEDVWYDLFIHYSRGKPFPDYPLAEKPVVKEVVPEKPVTETIDKYEHCKQWLMQLPEPYRDMAISQMDKEYIALHYYPAHSTLHDALHKFADWHDTKEGHKFWHCVYEYAVNGPRSQLPIIPDYITEIGMRGGSGTTLVINDSVSSTNSSKTKKKSPNVDFVSAFVTTQSKPKKKRLKLSIN